MAIALAGTVAGESRRWLPVVLVFCDAIASQWKPRQSEIVASALLPDHLTYEEIAASLTLPVSKQEVAKSLAGTKWGAIKLALDEFERTDWENGRSQPNAVYLLQSTQKADPFPFHSKNVDVGA